MRVLKLLLALVFTACFAWGCTAQKTLKKEGSAFCLKPEFKIAINQTAKAEIINAYGQPQETATCGKYEVWKYHYMREYMNEPGVGLDIAKNIPLVGLAAVGGTYAATDKGIIREGRTMMFYLDLASGVVKDYYYHDSNLQGHDESETMYLRAQPLKKQGKTKEAIDLLEKAVAANPQNHRALNDLAWMLIDLGADVDKGIAYARKAVEAFPDAPKNHGVLGVGYFKKGDKENAAKYLEAAIKLYPDYLPRDEKAHRYYASVLEQIKTTK